MRTSDLRDALNEVAAGTVPLSAADVLAAGKRHRRHRRMAAATGAALAVLAVTAVVLVAPWRPEARPVPLPAERRPTASVPWSPSAPPSSPAAPAYPEPSAMVQRYEFFPETRMGPNTSRTMITDRETEGPGKRIELLRTRERFALPPGHPHADRQEDTTISGVPVRIEVIGAAQQISWIQSGNLYTLTVVDRTEADTRELVAFIMQWYQRKR